MSETKAFIDACCKRCRARIGWYGTALEHPGCHRCGWKPNPETLKTDHEEMVNFRKLLAELRTVNPGWETRRKARVAAGLTLRRAAKLLEVAPTTLSEIECGENRPSDALSGRMARCYGG